MKFFKKPLSMVLAILIVISSIAIGAYAVVLTTTSKIQLESKSVYKVGENEVSKVAPNQEVMVEEYLTATIDGDTDQYLSGVFQLLYLYDKTVFSFPETTATGWKKTNITGNTTKIENLDVSYTSSESDYTTNTKVKAYFDDKSIDTTKYGWILVNSADDGYTVKFDGTFWAFKLKFTVKNNAPVDGVGEVLIAEGSESKDTNNYNSNVDVIYDTEASPLSYADYPLDNTSYKNSKKFVDFSLKNTKTTVTLNGSIVFDANGGKIDGTLTSKEYTGYYQTALGDSFVIPGAADVTKTDYTLAGWSETVNGAKLTDAQIKAFTYEDGTSVKTLYALWDKADAKYTYTVMTTPVGASGYTETVQAKSAAIDGKATDEVKVSDIVGDGKVYTVPDGYVLANPDDKITLVAYDSTDDTTVKNLVVQLNRESYNVTYVIKNGDNESDIAVIDKEFGANIESLTTTDAPTTINNGVGEENFGYKLGDTWKVYKGNSEYTNSSMPAGDLKVVNELVPEEITVKFAPAAEGGSWPADYTMTVHYNDASIPDPDTSKFTNIPDGYELKDPAEWKHNGTEAANLSNKVDVSNYPELTTAFEITLTPVLQLSTFTITYKLDGEDYETADKYLYTNPVTIKAKPVKEGYNVTDWTFTKVDSTAVTIADGDPMPAYDIIATATSTPIDYKINWTYTKPDSTVKTEVTDPIHFGDAIPAIETDDVENYTFDGWYTDPECTTKFTATTMPSRDLDLYGKYVEKAKILVTYKDADGKEMSTVNGHPGEALTAPAHTELDGYEFTWDKELDKIPDTDTVINEVKKAKNVTFTFNTDGGSEAPADAVAAYDTKANKPADPEKDTDNLVFAYWALPNGKPYDFDKTPEENFKAAGIAYAPSVELKAVYAELEKYNVTYKVDGEVYEGPVEVVFASAIPAPTKGDPSKEGYTFTGWKADVDGAKVGGEMPASDVVFTAEFKEIPSGSYTVTYLADDTFGREYTVDSFTVTAGDPVPVTEKVPTRLGYIFTGWEPEIPATMPEENLEFTATWELDETFIALVVGGTVVAGATVATIAAANAAAITTGAIIGGVVLVGGTYVLAKHTHKVTYLVDGEEYKVYYIIEGTKIIVPEDPTKEGCEFTGWNPEVPEKMPANDLVFEATWGEAAGDSDYNGAAEDVDVIPDTGSATAGIAAFAIISSAAAAAYVLTKKKREF